MVGEVDKVLKLFKSKVVVINVGLEHFYRELSRQGVKVAHVVWRPKPELEEDLRRILDKIL